MKRLIGIAVVLLFALTACGSSGSSYDHSADLANAAGISGCKPTQSNTLGLIKDGLDCGPNGDISVGLFESSTAQNAYMKMATQMGQSTGIKSDGTLLTGDNWLILCSSKSQCEDFQKKVGGKLT